MSTILVRPLPVEDIRAVARLHAVELTYSFNSRLGASHLASVYRAMLDVPGTFVGIACVDSTPAGVVSGTLDVRTLKPAILRSFGVTGKLMMVGRLLLHPTALVPLVEEIKSRPPIKAGGELVHACLTTIAVASSYRRMGLAARLVDSLEAFFLSHGTDHYWLDTIVENVGGRAFYQRQGFEEIAVQGRTVVFLKKLTKTNRP